MTDKILPLGSVVTLKNGDGSEVMIVSRASVIEVDDYRRCSWKRDQSCMG